jgi:hypothetical protein
VTTSRGTPADLDEDATQAVPTADLDTGPQEAVEAPVAEKDDAEGLAPAEDRPSGVVPAYYGSHSTSSSDLPELTPERPVTSAARRTGKVRKARLRMLRVEPWSVMKSAFVLSIAIGITFVVAVATLWSVVDAAGVFDVVGGLISDLTESQDSTGIQVTDYVGFSRVVGLATVIAVVDVVLLTALATLFAFLYNLSAALLGGLEVTLAEDD